MDFFPMIYTLSCFASQTIVQQSREFEGSKELPRIMHTALEISGAWLVCKLVVWPISPLSLLSPPTGRWAIWDWAVNSYTLTFSFASSRIYLGNKKRYFRCLCVSPHRGKSSGNSHLTSFSSSPSQDSAVLSQTQTSYSELCHWQNPPYPSMQANILRTP